MPQTVPKSPTKGAIEPDRREERQPLGQPVRLAADRHVHRPLDPRLGAVDQPAVLAVRSSPLGHAGGEDPRRGPAGSGPTRS